MSSSERNARINLSFLVPRRDMWYFIVVSVRGLSTLPDHNWYGGLRYTSGGVRESYLNSKI